MFPIWVWKKFDAGLLEEAMIVCGIEEKNREIAERMVKVAVVKCLKIDFSKTEKS